MIPLRAEDDALTTELNSLQAEQAFYQKQAEEATAFIHKPSYAERVVTRIGQIFESHGVSIKTEQRSHLEKARPNLPDSVNDITRLALSTRNTSPEQLMNQGQTPLSPNGYALPPEMQSGGYPPPLPGTEPPADDGSPKMEATIWTLKVQGSYLAMLASLRDINADPLKIITVMLDMMTPPDSGNPEWTLVLWL